MGSFNIGDLYASASLDISNFESSSAKLKNIVTDTRAAVESSNKTWGDLTDRLNKAGISFDSLSKKMEDDAVRLRQLNEQTKSIFSGQGGLIQGVKFSDERGGMQDYIQEALKGAQQIAATKQQAMAMERDAMARQKEIQDRNYADAVTKERQEQAVQQQRHSIEQEALRRQTELQDRMYGDALSQERQLREAEALRARQRTQMDQEWRRAQHMSSAASTIGMSMSAVGAAGIGAGIFVAKDAAEFQDSMVKSLAIVGQISDAMRDKMANAARDMAKETGIAAKSIAEDFGIMVKGGMTSAEALQELPNIVKFAVGTNSELHESTRQVITIMEGLKLPVTDVKRITEELTLANQLARGSVDQLATSLEGKSAAALRSARVSLEQALALTVAFSRAGVTASQSQTFLAQVIERLTTNARTHGNEMVMVNGQYQKFHDLVYDANGQIRPFVDILKILDSAFKGQSSEKIGAFFDDIRLGSSRGTQALKILLSQSDMLDKLSDAFKNAGGSVDLAFNTQLQSPLRQLDILKARFTDLAITLGIPVVGALQASVKAMEPLLTGIAGLSRGFGELPTGMQQFIMLGGGAASVTLLLGGGMLMLAGHVVRLKADLYLLTGMEGLAGLKVALGGILPVLAAVGTAATIVAGALVMVYEAKKSLDKDKESSTSDRWARVPLSSDDLMGGSSGGSVKEGVSQSIRDHRLAMEKAMTPSEQLMNNIKKAGEQAGSNLGDGMLDKLRESMKDMTESFKDMFGEGGVLAYDPEKILKKQIQSLNIASAFRGFQTEYNRVVESLSDSEQDAIHNGIVGLNRMVAQGADPRLLQASLHDLEVTLRQFSEEASERSKSITRQSALDAADTTLEGFRTRFESSTKLISEATGLVVMNGIDEIQKLINAGTDPRQVQQALREMEVFYQGVEKEIRQTDALQKEFNKTVSDFDREGKLTAKQAKTAEFAPLEERIPSGIFSQMGQYEDIAKKSTAMATLLKGTGVTAVETYRMNAIILASVAAQLMSMGADAKDVEGVLVKMWEANANSSGVSASEVANQWAKTHQDILTSLGVTVGHGEDLYRKLADASASSVRKANSVWKTEMSQLGRQVQSIIGGFENDLLNILIPKPGDVTDKMQPVIEAFRGAFTSLSAYSDPKAALEGVIESIQKAGTEAQANAIAVKYFGNTVGPQLARDLRTGAMSASDIAHAIDIATKSTVDYEQATSKATNNASNMWKNLLRDLEISVAKFTVNLMAKELLNWIFDLKNQYKTLGEEAVAAFKKIWSAIKDVIGITKDAASATKGVSDIYNLPTKTTTVPWFPGTTSGIPGSVPTVPGGGIGGAAGGAGGAVSAGASSMVSTITGIVTAAASVGTMISSIVFGLHAEKDADVMNKHTLEIDNELKYFRQDALNAWKGGFDRLGEFMNQNAEHLNNIFTRLGDMMNISYTPTLAMATGNPAALSASITSTGGSFQFTGPITVYANSPDEFVKQLKSRRIVRGMR